MFKDDNPTEPKGRPTSGKHFAREHALAKRKGELEQPNHDPLTSTVAKNYETSKKVESLLNKLAGYMAGEIPDTEDIDQLFPDGKKDDTGEVDVPNDNDDVTTNYTGYQPTNRDQNMPKIIVADENEVEIEEDDPIKEVEEEIPEDDN